MNGRWPMIQILIYSRLNSPFTFQCVCIQTQTVSPQVSPQLIKLHFFCLIEETNKNQYVKQIMKIQIYFSWYKEDSSFFTAKRGNILMRETYRGKVLGNLKKTKNGIWLHVDLTQQQTKMAIWISESENNFQFIKARN